MSIFIKMGLDSETNITCLHKKVLNMYFMYDNSNFVTTRNGL